MTSRRTQPTTTETPDGPLGDYPAEFRVHLEGQHYGLATIAGYGRAIRQLGRLMEEHDVELGDLTAERATELVFASDWRGYRRQYVVFMVRRFVNFLVELGVAKLAPTLAAPEAARAALRRDYEDYLRRQRGLSERSIGHCWRFADRFLTFRFGDESGDLARITAGDIVAFLQRLTTRKPPFRDKTPPTHLRNFFQYLFKCGLTTTNLALCIPSIAQRYGARLPRHLAPEQVEAVLAAVRMETPIGRRNYAMVLLLARLGLRAPEVIAMQLDDIDWRAGEIVVRGKGQRHDRMPLPHDVGGALADYIQRDRVTASRALFVTARAPHKPFRDGQMLNDVLRQAFASAGLKPPARYVGSHILRHSLATNLVRQGASLPEVGDLLRHRSRASTMIYARLDIDGLRSIAQPWPVAGGVK